MPKMPKRRGTDKMEERKLNRMVIAYLQNRLSELKEEEPHAFKTIRSYEDVLFDLTGESLNT